LCRMVTALDLESPGPDHLTSYIRIPRHPAQITRRPSRLMSPCSTQQAGGTTLQISVPDRTSHARNAESTPMVRARPPSAENLRQSPHGRGRVLRAACSRCPCRAASALQAQGLLPRRGVPEPQWAVVLPGHHRSTVRRPRHPADSRGPSGGLLPPQ
jgi:hypothetical protein